MAGPISAVFCDVGGPIYDDENFVVAVLAALDELRAADGQPAADRTTFRAVYRQILNQQSGSLRSALAQTFLGEAGRKGELHDLTRQYWVHPVGTMYDDALPFFQALAGKVTIGILANQEAAVIDALERDGIGSMVDVWGVSAVVGYEKPSPELFRWCMREAGVEPGNAIHVGNRLDTDVRPAKSLGLRTAWILRGEAPERPTDLQLREPDIAVTVLVGLADCLLSDDPFSPDAQTALQSYSI
ncbi:HAD family hydrolase [Microbacterium sp. NPDC076911]|uniref:HAD family hydrolase n=1 Tax=Microbacterium sp. NPDC076911 TaxID=3154958 RepID=UPI0034399CC6